MTPIYAIILAIVEGITEFLPISSTGHLILTSHLLQIPQTEFLKSFEIIIQLGAVLAVVNNYWRKYLTNIALYIRVLVAFIPTAIVGFTFYDFIKAVLFENTSVTLIALAVGGVILILIEKFYKTEKHHIEKPEEITLPKAFMIGVFQSLSVIPGVSRAASTIVGGMFMGMSRKAAVEFSFFLAVPTILAASGLDLLKSNFSYTLSEWNMLVIGFTGSFIVAHFVIKFFLSYVQKHSFAVFGWYRIILAVVYWLILMR